MIDIYVFTLVITVLVVSVSFVIAIIGSIVVLFNADKEYLKKSSEHYSRRRQVEEELRRKTHD